MGWRGWWCKSAKQAAVSFTGLVWARAALSDTVHWIIKRRGEGKTRSEEDAAALVLIVVVATAQPCLEPTEVARLCVFMLCTCCCECAWHLLNVRDQGTTMLIDTFDLNVMYTISIFWFLSWIKKMRGKLCLHNFVTGLTGQRGIRLDDNVSSWNFPTPHCH